MKGGDWIVLTKDDFVARWVGDPEAPPVVSLRFGNCTHHALFTWREPILPEIKHLHEGEKDH